jgi:hypothetical protein
MREPLKFNRPIAALFAKLLSTYFSAETVLRLEAIDERERCDGEDFFAQSTDDVVDWAETKSGKFGRNVYVNFGHVRADVAKTRSVKPDDFIALNGFVSDGSSDTIRRASRFGKAQPAFQKQFEADCQGPARACATWRLCESLARGSNGKENCHVE